MHTALLQRATDALLVPAAKATATTASAHAPSATASIAGTLLALTLVLGLIFALAWLMRRMPGMAHARNGQLRVVASLPLSARERLLVVEVAGQQLLLASGTSGTRMLQALPTPLPSTPANPPSPFAQLLAKHLGKSSEPRA